MLDRDDSALHAVQQGVGERATSLSSSYHLRDVCEAADVAQAFREERPDIVLHAAALKHVPLLEHHPREAFRVNVMGTLTVLSAAAAVGTQVLVNVSTDKASNPSTVLGHTKRLGEGLTAHFALRDAGRFLSVRLGNIIGSRGSVVPTFVDQLAHGGPLTVTHEAATRYVMSVDDAVDHILTATAVGHRGETLLPDMGDPVRIMDIATTLARMARTPPPIVVTGLRPGDKLHEHYVDDAEDPAPHPLAPGTMRVRVPPVDPVTVHLDRVLDTVAAPAPATGWAAASAERVEATASTGERRP